MQQKVKKKKKSIMIILSPDKDESFHFSLYILMIDFFFFLTFCCIYMQVNYINSLFCMYLKILPSRTAKNEKSGKFGYMKYMLWEFLLIKFQFFFHRTAITTCILFILQLIIKIVLLTKFA